MIDYYRVGILFRTINKVLSRVEMSAEEITRCERKIALDII